MNIPVTKILYFNIVFLFGCVIKHVRSPSSPAPVSPRPPSSYLSFQTPSNPNYNPCDRTKVNSKAQNAHDECQNECLAIKATISNFYRMYPDYITVKFLYNKCGMATEGRCSYFRKASYYPICWCHTPRTSQGRRRTALFVCHFGIPLIRKLTNFGIGLKRCSSKLANMPGSANDIFANCAKQRKRKMVTGEMEEEGETFDTLTNPENSCQTDIGAEEIVEKNIDVESGMDSDGELDGLLLMANFKQSGNTVKALLDTGSGVTFINKKLTNNILSSEEFQNFLGGNNQKIEISGITTIDVQTEANVKIYITGLVAVMKRDILLGCDFLAKYAAKIKISERTMELFIDRTPVKIPTRFVKFNAQVSMMNSDLWGYTPLTISARLNGFDTNIIIDTGSTISLISSYKVNPRNIRPDKTKTRYMSGRVASSLGAVDVDLWIEDKKFCTEAVVPQYQMTDDLLTGNSFNKKYIELIDFENETVTLKVPGLDNRVTTRAFIKCRL